MNPKKRWLALKADEGKFYWIYWSIVTGYLEVAEIDGPKLGMIKQTELDSLQLLEIDETNPLIQLVL